MFPTLTISSAVTHLQQEHQLITMSTQQFIAAETVEEHQIPQVNLNGNAANDGLVTLPKELILISLVSQEQALFNPKHEHYRSVQRKDAKWLDIAENMGWTDVQCKAKWKALRDQYCRELKRSKANGNSPVKWKYFKELDFLRPYALARHYRLRATNARRITPNQNNNYSGSNSSNTTTSAVTATTTTTLKLENGLLSTNGTIFNATVADVKNDSQTRLISTLSSEQVGNVMQQDGNWNYISSVNSSRCDVTQSEQQQAPNILGEDALYSALVDCVQQAQQQQNITPDDEDDDPIHTFLNIESYFEKELITLIQQEDIIYNIFNRNYRNAKLKLEAWEEIARKLKKPVKQCRSKWKALRDQFIREHKRLRARENSESVPRWKHYDALNFLQRHVKTTKGDDDPMQLLQMPKTETDTDLDETPIVSTNHTTQNVSSNETQQQQQQQQQQQHNTQQQIHLPTLTALAAMQQHQQHQHQIQRIDESEAGAAALCVAATYDEMDIEEYINGEATAGDDADEADNDNERQVDDDDEMQECVEQQVELKAEPQFCDYTVNSSSRHSMVNGNGANLGVSEEQPTDYIAIKMSGGIVINNPNEHIIGNQSSNSSSNNSAIASSTQQHQQQQQQQLKHQQQQMVPEHPQTPNSATHCGSTNSSSTPLPATITAAIATADEDEIGAFFKAVAMKIRNANLPPIAFTDLQIDILRVINETLRNH